MLEFAQFSAKTPHDHVTVPAVRLSTASLSILFLCMTLEKGYRHLNSGKEKKNILTQAN